MLAARLMRLVAVALLFALFAAGCERLANYTDQEHVSRAKTFLGKNDLRAAEIELKNAVAKNPRNAEARWELGRLYLTQRRGQDAEKELRQAQALGMNPATLKVPLARAYLLQGDFERLLREIEPAANDSATNTARLLALRGDALVGARRFREGCAAYGEGQAADPEHAVEARWGLALCATARGDLDAARGYLEKARQIEPDNDGTWARLGEFAQMQGNAEAAQAAFGEALKRNPLNAEALIGRAAIAISRGDFAGARKDLETLDNAGIEHPGLLHVGAAMKQARGQLDGALELAQRLEKRYPRYFPGWLLAAQFHYAKGNLGLAEQYVSRYLTVQPANRSAVLLKADILARSGRAAEIPPLTEPLLGRYPDDARLLAATGQAYLLLGDYPRAQGFLERALAVEPGNAGSQVALAVAHLGRGEREKGLALLEEVAARDQKGVTADLLLVAEYNRGREYDRALASIDRIERKEPQSALPHRLRGGVLLLRKDRVGARKALEAGLAKDPADLLTAAALADLDLAEGRPEAARERFERMLARHPGNTDIMVALAGLAARAGDEKAFVDWLSRAARQDAKALRPRLMLAEHHLKRGRADQALALATEAARANPDDPQALAFLGRIQMASGARENAVASFSRLAGLLADPTPAQVELARAHLSLRRYGDARSAIEQALARSPDYLPALQVAGDLELLAGNPAKALGIAQRLYALAPRSPAGLVLRGEAQMRQGRYGAAVESFAKALALDPNAGTQMIRLHQALLFANRAAEADARLADWLKAHPDQDAVRLYAAENAVVRRRWPAARDAYEALLARHPEQAALLNNLALVYLELADPRALATAERAFKAAPEDPLVMDTLGWVLTRRGEVKRALPLLRQAVEKRPELPSLRYHYGVALAQAGDRLGAARELDAALARRQPFPEEAEARTLRKSL